jgi:hypothetical protein
VKTSRNFVLLLGAVFVALMLAPRSAVAQGVNCPTEPTQTTISDGEVYNGSNCVLHAIGDIDIFKFPANQGDTYQITLAITVAANSNICLKLYDPNGNPLDSGCTAYNNGANAAVVIDQKLTMTGTYQINVTEVSNVPQQYALSLERLYPFPPNATPINTFGTVDKGDIAEPSDSNAFTFYGVTTGKYQVTAALSGSILSNICMTVYAPDGSLVVPSSGTNPGCTAYNNGANASVVIDFTPPKNGTYMEFIQVNGNDGTQTFTMEVACVFGMCTQPPPLLCTLKDSLSYDASTSTLTMNFTVENSHPVTWNAWLSYQSTITNVVSASQPATTTPVVIKKTASLGKEGTVGVLSTFTTPTTPTKGIICSSYTQINTGTP